MAQLKWERYAKCLPIAQIRRPRGARRYSRPMRRVLGGGRVSQTVHFRVSGGLEVSRIDHPNTGEMVKNPQNRFGSLGKPRGKVLRTTFCVGIPPGKVPRSTWSLGKPRGKVPRTTFCVGIPPGKVPWSTWGLGKPRGKVLRTTFYVGIPPGKVPCSTPSLGKPSGNVPGTHF